MKKLYCIVILFCFVGFGFAEEPQLFLGDDGKPFTGVNKNYPKGEEIVYSETSYVNGIRQGTSKIYQKKTDVKAEKFNLEDYQLWTEANYINDKMDSDFKIYGLNGLLRSITPYKNGKKEGLALIYDRDGKLIIETMYRDDEMNGAEKWYMDCNGNNYRIEWLFRDNTHHGTQRAFINERLFKEYNIFDDKLSGAAQNHVGDFISVYSQFADNKLNGEFLIVDRLGKTKMVTQFKDGAIVGSTYVYKHGKSIIEIIIADNDSAHFFCIAEDKTKKTLLKEKSEFIRKSFVADFVKIMDSECKRAGCDYDYNSKYFQEITLPFIVILKINSVVSICK